MTDVESLLGFRDAPDLPHFIRPTGAPKSDGRVPTLSLKGRPTLNLCHMVRETIA